MRDDNINKKMISCLVDVATFNLHVFVLLFPWITNLLLQQYNLFKINILIHLRCLHQIKQLIIENHKFEVQIRITYDRRLYARYMCLVQTLGAAAGKVFPGHCVYLKAQNTDTRSITQQL